MTSEFFDKLTAAPAFPDYEADDELMNLLATVAGGDMRAAGVVGDWLEERGDARYRKVRRRCTKVAVLQRLNTVLETFRACDFVGAEAVGAVVSAYEAVTSPTAEETAEFAGDLVKALPVKLVRQVYAELCLQVLSIFPQTRAYVKQVRLRTMAVDAVNAFTRVKLREGSVYRRIMPPMPVNNDQLAIQIDNDRPVTIRDDVEPGTITREKVRLACNNLSEVRRVRATLNDVARNEDEARDMIAWGLELQDHAV